MNRQQAIEQAARELLIEINAIGVAPPQELSALEKALALPPDDAGCETCAQVYQVVGVMWNDTGDDAYIPVLDNLSDSANGDKPRHDNLLPFQPKADPRRAELVRRIGEWHDRNTAKNIGANMQNKRREEAHWLLNDIRDYLEGK